MAVAAAARQLGKVDAHYGYRLGVDGFVSRRDVGRILGFSMDAIDGYLADGKLRWVKLPNGRVRICKRSLENMLDMCERSEPQV